MEAPGCSRRLAEAARGSWLVKDEKVIKKSVLYSVFECDRPFRSRVAHLTRLKHCKNLLEMEAERWEMLVDISTPFSQTSAQTQDVGSTRDPPPQKTHVFGSRIEIFEL